MDLLGVTLEDKEGLFLEGVHGPLLSSMLNSLYQLRGHLHDFRGKGIITISRAKHLGRVGVAIRLSSEKPKMLFEVHFYQGELRIVSVSLDNRCRGRATPLIPKILMTAITNPREYVRITLRAGPPSGYIVWLKYGFYPERKYLEKYSPLLDKGWNGLSSGLITLIRQKTCNSLFSKMSVYFEGYLDLRDKQQVAMSLDYVLRRARNGSDNS